VPAPEPRYGFLSDALAAADAAAFVTVGSRENPTLRYLARVDRPGTFAFVYVDGDACLLAPAGSLAGARRAFPGEHVYGPDEVDGAAVGQRVASVLDSYGVSGPVLTPRTVPHDTAVYLERAGHPVSSTDAVHEERREKTREEVRCVARAGDAAAAALAEARSLLADADPIEGGRKLAVDGRTLTTGVLRRELNAALAERGCEGGETTVVAGRGAADPTFSGDVPLEPGAPVALALAPRGPRGYHAALTRTLSPATEGGWDRRAGLAVESALDVGLGEIAAGVSLRSVDAEMRAELASFGLADDAIPTLASGGVGLAAWESPSTDSTLLAGDTVAVRIGIADPERGPVRFAETVRVTEEGYDVLTDAERSLVP